MSDQTTCDILIIGSGLGASIVASRIASLGASIIMLERGDFLPKDAASASEEEIYVQSKFTIKEQWNEVGGGQFRPWQYYNVGGNTKFFGAVMMRLRESDFKASEQSGGLSPEWPFTYDEIEPFYSEAEELFGVRGNPAEDPTEPWRSKALPYPKIQDDQSVAKIRDRLSRVGLSTFSTPLAVNVDLWKNFSRLHWDGFPNISEAKSDAENRFLTPTLKLHQNVILWTDAKAVRIQTDASGRNILRVDVDWKGKRHAITPRYIILSAGAVNSAALLLRSADEKLPRGVSNNSDQVGRNLMAHHCTAIIGVDPRIRNDGLIQKTIASNDYYFEKNGKGAGHLQMLGRVTGTAMKSMVGARALPSALLDWLSLKSAGWFALSEDLPLPESRVLSDSAGRISLTWNRPNAPLHDRFVKSVSSRLRQAGFPFIFRSRWDTRHLTHQCGTVRIGDNPATAPLDPFCRSYDHPNLWVIDASFMPSSSAVNPSLTIAAQALRCSRRLLMDLA